MPGDTQQNPDQASVGHKVAAVRANSLDEARLKAAHLLSVPPEQLVLTVTAQHSRGFFGLGGVELDVEARWSPPGGDGSPCCTRRPSRGSTFDCDDFLPPRTGFRNRSSSPARRKTCDAVDRRCPDRRLADWCP